jgi:DNA-binding MarR family transcriptional regulator
MKTEPAGNVNMIDLNTRELDQAQELLFFAFRNLTAEPDRVLAERGLSRVHHRVLYFVRRNPGLGPGDLLRILRVSKQALARPLRELAAQGLLLGEAVPENRRRKRLTLTPAGLRFERRISALQRRRFAEAFSAAGPTAAASWREVMSLLGVQQSRHGGGVRRAVPGRSKNPS